MSQIKMFTSSLSNFPTLSHLDTSSYLGTHRALLHWRTKQYIQILYVIVSILNHVSKGSEQLITLGRRQSFYLFDCKVCALHVCATVVNGWGYVPFFFFRIFWQVLHLELSFIFLASHCFGKKLTVQQYSQTESLSISPNTPCLVWSNVLCIFDIFIFLRKCIRWLIVFSPI